MKICSIDFEFNDTNSDKLNLVSCALKTNTGIREKYWLQKDPNEKGIDFGHLLQKAKLIGMLDSLGLQGFTFLTWAAEAEARSFIALGLDVRHFKWIDLMVEYKCVTNHNNKLAYGKQLIDGKVVNSYPPKPKYLQNADEKNLKSHKTRHNLAAATYKLLDVLIDTERKNRIRDIIIAGDPFEIHKHKQEILEYNDSDIDYLDQLFTEIVGWYEKLLKARFKPDQLLEEMLWRGKFSAYTGQVVNWGYPINYKETRNLALQIDNILWDIGNEINQLFPEIAPFSRDKKTKKVKISVKTVLEWVDKSPFANDWTKTKKTKIYSNKLEEWTKHYPYRHEYPTTCFAAQMIRYYTAKQNLGGFNMVRKGDKKIFWDYYGKDERVRPYLNTFGSQGGRNQPSSTGFVFLKPAWMRSLVQTKKGKALCHADWKSQEFLLSGVLSKDWVMTAAYHSGDVYVYFAKVARAMPKDGTKETHPEVRFKFKQTTLGLSYMMTKIGLAKKLTQDLGTYVDEDEAQELIDLFDQSFPTFYCYKEIKQSEYFSKKHVKIADGWYMWGDNQNFRSVVNCEVQGTGAACMRKAQIMAMDQDLKIVFPNHDALVMEFDSDDLSQIDILGTCMEEASRFWFKGNAKQYDKATAQIDFKIWSPDYANEEVTVYTPEGRKVAKSRFYIDERSLTEYTKLCKYFKNPPVRSLL